MIPQIPMVNLGSLYLNGMQLSWTSITTLTVQLGQARDSTDINDIVFSTSGAYAPAVAGPLVVSIASNGVNALDTGTVAASTLYYVFAVGDSTKYSTPCALLSLSATAPTLPAHYDMFRRIGAVRTNGSSQILLFWQEGVNGQARTMWYDASIATGITAGTSTAYADVNLEGAVPPSASSVVIQASLTAGTAFDKVFLQPYGGTASYAILTAPVVTGVTEGMLVCPVGLNSGAADLKYKVSSGGDAVALNVQAYVDQL